MTALMKLPLMVIGICSLLAGCPSSEPESWIGSTAEIEAFFGPWIPDAGVRRLVVAKIASNHMAPVAAPELVAEALLGVPELDD